ncbi:hypothetical protein [Acrocarpospora catenulata]|uniref:hypothetical protein n=1 Tax=Acrocarpospora catenulata TaxID=2836182 RepID=UPI00202391CA|nr:hypothetical protein [Acrocarpospora catenulata]
MPEAWLPDGWGVAAGDGNDTAIASAVPGPGFALLTGLSDPVAQAQATTATTTSMPVNTDTRRRQ